MWRRELRSFCMCVLLFSSLFCLSGYAQQSSTNSITAKLNSYIQTLTEVKSKIDFYKSESQTLNEKIAKLQQELDDSSASYQTQIDELKTLLESSRKQLKDSQKDLLEQEKIYKALYKDYMSLKMSLNKMALPAKILGSALVVSLIVNIIQALTK